MNSLTSIPEILAAAVRYHQSGKWNEANQLYRQILQQNPDHPDALHLIGVIASQQGKPVEALPWIQRALVLEPNALMYRKNLGIVYGQIADQHRREGNFVAAAELYQKAIAQPEPSAQTHNDFGNVLKEMGYIDAAIEQYQTAIRKLPNLMVAYRNLGMIYSMRRDFSQAMPLFQQALQLDPNNPDTLNQIGGVLVKQRQFENAIKVFDQTLRIAPTCLESVYNRAFSLEAIGRIDEAILAYKQGLDFHPDQASSLAALVHLKQQICQWDDIESLSLRLIACLENTVGVADSSLVTPLSFMGLPIPTTASQQAKCARNFTLGTLGQIVSKNAKSLTPRDPKARIRIGYLSGDFQTHPVAFAIADFIEQHDRKRFEVFAYSFGQDDGRAMRSRLKSAFEHFRDIEHLTIVEASEIIKRDHLDILVDLQGHTKNARTGILAHRPAPIQVSYLGFAGTMGADFMDAVLCDDFVVPMEQQPYFFEKIIHLPGCFLAQSKGSSFDEKSLSRLKADLPEKAFVFCAFHSPFKITPRMMDMWANLLRDNSEAVMWLQSAHPSIQLNLCREFASRSIPEDRLIFAPRVASRDEHLARQKLADLFLDTFPYNSHSTAGDALRVGLPLLTLSGETFASRVAGSLLRSLDLHELITRTHQDYFEVANRLAKHPDQLRTMRQKLQKALATTDLFDGAAFARKIEATFEQLLVEFR
jgi:protein O-GlcNAc transferase